MRRTTLVQKDVRSHWVGDGFYVRTMFSYASPGVDMSPFLLFDYAEPHEYPGDGQRRGVGAHPHKGFETVTIAYQGEVQHRDSSGGGGTIGPGDVQWMTAGAGLLHEELHSPEFSRAGGVFEMVQLWVNLPARFKREAPHYQTLSRDAIPVVGLEGEVGTLRVIAGEFAGRTGPARTYTPINLWDIEVTAAGSISLPVPAEFNAGVMVLSGAHQIGDELVNAGEFAVLGSEGAEVAIETRTLGKMLLLAGEPINEPVVGEGPFVMNTTEEIREAFAAYRAGAFGQL